MSLPFMPCRSWFRTCLSHLIYTVRPCLIHFTIWFTQCGRVWFTLAVTRPCHPRPCHSSQAHDIAWPSRKSLWTNCPRSASSGYHAEFHEVVIRRIPISDAGGQCDTKHRLSWTRKRVVAAHYKKADLLHCWTCSRIFLATMRTFTKDMTLSEQGRGAAWHVWINAQRGRETAWERHGRSMGVVCYVWIGLYGLLNCDSIPCWLSAEDCAIQNEELWRTIQKSDLPYNYQSLPETRGKRTSYGSFY